MIGFKIFCKKRVLIVKLVNFMGNNVGLVIYIYFIRKNWKRVRYLKLGINYGRCGLKNFIF